MLNKHFLAVLSLAVVGGCSHVPDTEVADFSQSASNMLEHVSGVVNEYNDAKLHRDLTLLAAKYSGSSNANLKSSEFEPLAEFQLPDSSPILGISNALREYANALHRLAIASNEADVSLAAFNFYQAAESSSWNGLKPSEQEAGLIQSAMATLASGYSEEKKQRVLKSIIVSSDPAISELSDSLMELIKKNQIGTAIYLSRSYVLSEEIQDFNRRADIRQLPLNKSREEIERLYEQWETMAATPLLVEQTLQAIDTFKSTHNELALSLVNETFSKATLIQTQARMKEVSARFNTTKNLLASCKTGVEVQDSKLVCKGEAK
ncbi:hypothetical protein VINI7043_05871 [Vibrio nigripulchritudo ATCC 27043]|uniref:hypothetical protein n=1 Tax=Vibrio nigripulchritudo TaxID=28173 RepID=UPI00021C2E02|nr:hypothetical protein [Vibrio nigripulchritudo]EGU56184.1 hypothetical protein VINI7043_05871 [Vibrio nigripulchritudo ATCC 27043]